MGASPEVKDWGYKVSQVVTGGAARQGVWGLSEHMVVRGAQDVSGGGGWSGGAGKGEPG